MNSSDGPQEFNKRECSGFPPTGSTRRRPRWHRERGTDASGHGSKSIRAEDYPILMTRLSQLLIYHLHRLLPPCIISPVLLKAQNPV